MSRAWAPSTKWFAWGWFLLAVAPLSAAPPNIVFAFADDLGRYASFYASIDGPGTLNDVVQTPNIDSLAREGVAFRHAFVNAPSCTPCRSSLLSGQYFWRTGRGAILRGAIWDLSIPSFPLLLKNAGYHIGKSYKVWSPGVPADAPFGGQKFAYEKSGRKVNQFSQNATQMVKKGESVEEAKHRLLKEVRDNFRLFLAERKPGQPFLYWYGATNVHRPWVRGSGKVLWGIDPERLKGKVPSFLPDVPEVREDLADYLGEIQAFDASVGVLVEVLKEAGEWDNTYLFVSGDHGAPGFPRGKCNLYDFGVAVSLVARGPGVPGGRVVDDFALLPDLAPTFLELGEVNPPSNMTAKSLLPILKSDRSGLVDPSRTYVITGRERHVDTARPGEVPYPQRAIRTKDALYILNFKPDRWPMGDPFGLQDAVEPSAALLAVNTFVTFRDMDAGPTKAWLVEHREDPRWKMYYEIAFGKRPREELYLLASDPEQMRNLAADPTHEKIRAELHDRLMAELENTGDPRVTGDGQYFETPPLAGPVPEGEQRRPRGANKKP
ncbi:MAG: sulfatase [Planctomycetota bacterium]